MPRRGKCSSLRRSIYTKEMNKKKNQCQEGVKKKKKRLT